MAISKERKREIVTEYGDWIQRSQALIVTDYKGLTVKDMDELRKKVREAGCEYHIVKNTLTKLAFTDAGLSIEDEHFEGSTAIGFAFDEVSTLAKVMVDFAKDTDILKVKGGFLGEEVVSAAEIKALAELPPMPVMRAQLLGTLMAPANKLVGVLAEPGRQVASVLKAYAEQEATPEAA
ncbi:MAG: 50S ribosomal protein L10 [Anaerolineales bacterium]